MLLLPVHALKPTRSEAGQRLVLGPVLAEVEARDSAMRAVDLPFVGF